METGRKTVFKVVGKSSRKGTNYLLSAKECATPHSVYIKTYKKNALVEAVEGSLGIFTFCTRKAAQKFVNGYGIGGWSLILRVTPIGRGTVPKKIALGGASLKAVEGFYSGYSLYSPGTSPKGTICYPAVTVIS